MRGKQSILADHQQGRQVGLAQQCTLTTQWPPIRGKLAPVFWGGAPSQPLPNRSLFCLQGHLPLAVPRNQRSTGMSSVRLVVIFGLCPPLVRRLRPTYIADISHVPLVLPEPPRHVDIGGRSRYRGVGAALARQAVANHPCQDGA